MNTRQKKALFGIAMLVGTYVVVELLALLLIGLQGGGDASLSELRERRSARLLADGPGALQRTPTGGYHTVVLHPFLGYVNDNKAPEIHDFGFLGAQDPFFDDSDAFVVAITGGSVAQNLWKSSAEELAARMRSLPGVEGRPVRVICLAIFGYKQPQQLAGLSYFLAIGGRIDVLVNIDGFNEIANGRNIEAYQAGRIHPAFPAPYIWLPITGTLTSLENTRLVGEIGVLRGIQLQLARLGARLGFSATASLFWSLADQAVEGRVLLLQAEASRASGESRQKLAYFQTGPRRKVPERDVYSYVAELWFRSSLIMESIARGSQISYYHFLQPNQYVPGSKKLVGREKKVWDAKGIFGRHVTTGYPLLQEAGSRLRDEGVRFVDLTRVFENESRSIYIDDCCHVNDYGNHLMAERIFETIRDDFAARP